MRSKKFKSIELTDDQKQAIEEIKMNLFGGDGIATLKGFAGAGKTTVIQKIIDEIESDLNEIYLLAPTHKAAEVLGRRTKKSVTTVHSAFGLRPEWDGEGGYKFVKTCDEPTNFIYKSLLAIDEASMIDDRLYNYIINAKNQYNLKVLFCGDPAQLPPVNHEMSPALKHDGFTLNEIVRQEEGNPILATSQEVRKNGLRHKFKEKVTSDGNGVYVLNDVGEFFESALDDFDTPRYRDTGDFNRVLVYRNDTVDEYNQTFRSALYNDANIEYLEGEWLVCREPWTPISSGKEYEPIIQNSEEIVIKDRDIIIQDGWIAWELIVGSYPGSKDERRIKILHESEQNRYERKLEKLKEKALEDEYRWPEYYDLKEKFANVDYNYAQTTHTAQGSTFNRVYVDTRDLKACYRKEERNSLAYVACSRPSHRLNILTP